VQGDAKNLNQAPLEVTVNSGTNGIHEFNNQLIIAC
jgi:hypothetical protein